MPVQLIRETEWKEGRPGSVLQNLLELLKFWQFFYGVAKRDQDCEALERSSKIMFTEWRAIVDDALLASAENERSIKFWMNFVPVGSPKPSSPSRIMMPGLSPRRDPPSG